MNQQNPPVLPPIAPPSFTEVLDTLRENQDWKDYDDLWLDARYEQQKAWPSR